MHDAELSDGQINADEHNVTAESILERVILEGSSLALIDSIKGYKKNKSDMYAVDKLFVTSNSKKRLRNTTCG